MINNVESLVQFEGSIDTGKLLDSILVSKRLDSYGDIWESVHKCDCDRCPFKKNCDTIYETLEQVGVELYCGQIVDILLGDKSISDFI